MRLRRPRNSTLFSILVFLVSFAFWLGQPQPVKNYSYVNIPELSSTTTVPVAVETTVVETTIPTETTIDPALVESTVPSETTVLP
ncbi:MAG: hypothetical protein ACOVLJ_09090 [Ilumatobacteraceae bacterium]|jgi:hypothetical protein